MSGSLYISERQRTLSVNALIKKYLMLKGEDVIRISTGEIVSIPSDLVIFVCNLGSGLKLHVQYHRAKYLLHHGNLPTEIDHHDRDRGNNFIANLRPATRQQNMQNMQNMRPRKRMDGQE
jgi:hypothetical protein